LLEVIECIKLTRKIPFILVYGQEVVIPLEYLIPSLHIAAITNMKKRGTIQEILSQLMELEKDRIMASFHQEVQKAKEKDLHDRHIRKKKFKEGDLVLFYDSKYLQHPGKFRMH
jgi:hypothetical protein